MADESESRNDQGAVPAGGAPQPPPQPETQPPGPGQGLPSYPGAGPAPVGAPPAWQPAPGSPPPAPGYQPPYGYQQQQYGYQQPGTAPPGTAPPGYGQPGYGQPGYGQPGYGQPGYGAPYPPGYGTPGYGYKQGPVGPGGVPLASFWLRVGGWLIDWVIVGVVGFGIDRALNAGHVTWVSIHYTTTVNGQTTDHYTHFSWLSPVVLAVLAILYGAILCGSKRGQTVGMMAVGAKAVDLETGQTIGFARALWRAIFEYILFVAAFIPWVLDMLFPSWDAKRQTLHDKVSRTVVLKINS